MLDKVVYTSNVAALAAALEALAERSPSQPGVVLVHGETGFGKTIGTRHLAVRDDALFITAIPFWSPHAMLSKLTQELHRAPRPRTAAMFDEIARELTVNPRAIFLDEADCIADKQEMIETLRILHDLTAIPLVIVGMAEFRRKLYRRPQLARRIQYEIQFKPLTNADARKIAGERCEYRIADDLVEALNRRVHGSAGLLVNELERAERFARKHTGNVLSLADYRERLGGYGETQRRVKEG
jgi:AAA domain-containing protein